VAICCVLSEKVLFVHLTPSVRLSRKEFAQLCAPYWYDPRTNWLSWMSMTTLLPAAASVVQTEKLPPANRLL